MTDKHKAFCENYVIDLNGTQAAIRAGYSKKTANEQASRLLANVNIKRYVSKLQKELSERTQITQEMVLNEFAKIGFSDIKNYFNSDQKQKDITQLENKLSAAVSSIKVTETEFKGVTTIIKEFKLHDKIAALVNVSKHIGFFEKDNQQKNTIDEGLEVIFKNMSVAKPRGK